IAIQLIVLVAVLLEFFDSFYIFYAVSIILSSAAVIWILNDNSNPAYKLAWIIPILIFPIFGGLFYLVFGRIRLNKNLKMEMIASADRIGSVRSEDRAFEALEAANPQAARQSRYLSTNAQSPLWDHTATEYLPTGEIAFERLLGELKKAERFIFLEYFIIEEGVMWKAILGVLSEKARQGLDVRVMYDDLGCSAKLPSGYNRRLEALGIKCAVFNPMKPYPSPNLNHRDHRKIAVIDGSVGFTGGLNLADEYINKVERFGYWKDSAIMLKGDAVWSLTLMFLKIWSHMKGEEADHLRFKPVLEGIESDGFVQPFGDSPLDDEPVGENVYLNLMGQVKDYLYITTPYLILDNEMLTALALAAKSGVDVRIITPHIPDKWYVHAVTRANYKALVDSGVR
ncbi:MAG TPA: phospholipase D-like domain-containing protein, partial [Rectinemataceae bacterium]|nr:phospholipase D-like domain-containing protein [Rectinemataceae bacterium]